MDDIREKMEKRRGEEDGGGSTVTDRLGLDEDGDRESRGDGGQSFFVEGLLYCPQKCSRRNRHRCRAWRRDIYGWKGRQVRRRWRRQLGKAAEEKECQPREFTRSEAANS